MHYVFNKFLRIITQGVKLGNIVSNTVLAYATDDKFGASQDHPQPQSFAGRAHRTHGYGLLGKDTD